MLFKELFDRIIIVNHALFLCVNITAFNEIVSLQHKKIVVECLLFDCTVFVYHLKYDWGYIITFE